MNELSIVETLRRMAARRGSAKPHSGNRGAGLILGIGDDCAIFRPQPGVDLLFKTDQSIEDAHFRRDQPPALIGQRALGRALSDIASMGGDPLVCLVSLAIPPEVNERWIAGFYRGLLALARSTGTALSGGGVGARQKG